MAGDRNVNGDAITILASCLTLLVQLKPNGMTLERESSKPCHMIYILNGQVTDLIFLGCLQNLKSV